MDIFISNANIFVEGSFQKLNLAIKDGRFAYIGDQKKKAKENFDFKDKYIIPGAIDSQVHFREPGLNHKDDIYHGSRAALLGGISAYFEMPNTNPSTTNRENFEEKLRIAKRNSFVDYAFYMGATKENLEELSHLESIPGCCGIKTFMGSSTGNLLLYNAMDLEYLARHAKKTMAFHCEDEDRMKERKGIAEKAQNPAAHPIWRDEESAFLATKKIVEIAKRLNRRVHILHVTTKKEIEYLKENKKWASIEVTPQHLSLNAPDCYEKLGSYAQMNPPIRSIEHQEALWQAINDGSVDVIGSDHAPHTKEEKNKSYPNSPSGMPGVESLLPLMLNHVNQGRLSLERLVDLIAIRPLELFRIQNRNPIEIDGDASLTIIDMKLEKPFQNHYKCAWSPFEGQVLKGWPIGLILHGQFLMQNQEILGLSKAQELAFS